MTSLAFILNPLDRNSNAATKRPLPVLPTSMDHLPALSAAIAPSFHKWTGPHHGLAAFMTSVPTTTIAAHRFALDASHLADVSRDRPSSVDQARKKQRLQYIAAKYANGDNEHDDEDVYEDGAASPTTSSEGELSSCDDSEPAVHEEDGAKAHHPSSKKKTRLCKEKGCTSLAVSRRSCVRHGGGSRCTFEGCTNGAKLRNRCFQHGGSTICLAAGCNSKAKRYGYCWSHGGGRICSTEGCVKVAAQGGSCWAHGGGNRCKLESCSKRSYQKHGYYCKAHASYNL